MATNRIETRSATLDTPLHPALEKIQAFKLLRELQENNLGSIIEACIPNYLPDNDSAMRLATFTRTMLNRMDHWQNHDVPGGFQKVIRLANEKLDRFLREHRMIVALGLSQVEIDEDQGLFGRMRGIALLAEDNNKVVILTTHQRLGTWNRYASLEPDSPVDLNSIFQEATPIPVYLPNRHALDGWEIGFLGARTIKLA